jgi:hypothetical protein
LADSDNDSRIAGSIILITLIKPPNSRYTSICYFIPNVKYQ